MPAGISRTARAAGGALALALCAGLVLGTAPANAETFTDDVSTGQRGGERPSFEWAVKKTQGEADQRCFSSFGFRTRGTDPIRLYSKDGVWTVTWKCSSN